MSEDFQLPNPEQAIGVLDSLYAEAFFNKMAEYGLVPETQEGALAMLETAAQLDALPEQPSEKSASVDPFVDANEKLASVLQQHGVGPDRAQVQQDSVKQAAAALSTNPDLYASVLSLKAAEAMAAESDGQEESQEATS